MPVPLTPQDGPRIVHILRGKPIVRILGGRVARSGTGRIGRCAVQWLERSLEVRATPVKRARSVTFRRRLIAQNL